RNQLSGETNAFGFVAVEQRVRCPAFHDRRQLPGKVDGVANPGVHALTAGRAVDMRGITAEEGASLAEMLRHPVMHVIGRKPVDMGYRQLHLPDRMAFDIVERQRFRATGALITNRADQARTSFAGEREHGNKIGFIEIDVQFSVNRRSLRLDVSNIEEVLVGAAWKAGCDGLAYLRA